MHRSYRTRWMAVAAVTGPPMLLSSRWAKEDLFASGTLIQA
jgi:hypothetical protein